MSLHVDLHASHVTGQLRIMNSGFSLHSPAAPHPGHSSFRSLHSGVHRPQLVGHSRSMASGLASHSPCMAQLPQEASVSLHECVHVPQESGQISAMYFCERRVRAICVRGCSRRWRACERAQSCGQAHGIVARALAIARPVGAVGTLVVADATVNGRDEERTGQHRGPQHLRPGCRQHACEGDLSLATQQDGGVGACTARPARAGDASQAAGTVRVAPATPLRRRSPAY